MRAKIGFLFNFKRGKEKVERIISFHPFCHSELMPM